MEFAFVLNPELGHAQVIQARRQPSIGAIARENFLAQGAPKRVLMRCDPRLHVREPMVAFGDNEGQPDHQHLPQTQARPMAIGGEVFVDQLGHTHLQ
jgi:hypothetical protein